MIAGTPEIVGSSDGGEGDDGQEYDPFTEGPAPEARYLLAV